MTPLRAGRPGAPLRRILTLKILGHFVEWRDLTEWSVGWTCGGGWGVSEIPRDLRLFMAASLAGSASAAWPASRRQR